MSAHTSSAAPSTALAAPVELPDGVAPAARALGMRALANVPAAPRAPTPRMRNEQLSMFRGVRGIWMMGAGLAGFFAAVAVVGTGPNVALTCAGIAIVCAAVSALKSRSNARLVERGLPALARVDHVTIQEQRGPGGGADSAFVRYTFVVRGEEQHGSAMVDVADAKELARAGVVPVVYDPARPERSLPWLGALDVAGS